MSAGAPFDKSDYSPYTTFGFEQLTVSVTAVGFTAGSSSNAARAIVSADPAGGQVRYRVDAAPTASVGHVMNAGDEIAIIGPDIKRITFIRSGGVDGLLNCSYAR